MAKEKLIIVGTGGLGREVLWAARRAQDQVPKCPDIIGFTADDLPKGDQVIDGLPFLGLIGQGLTKTKLIPTHFICAIGNNLSRQRVSGLLESMGLIPFTVIDPSVILGPGIAVGPGSYVGAGSILSPSSSLGRHIIINHGTSIGHDSNLGDFSQACPGTRVSGAAIVGEGVLLGSNSVIAPMVSIGAWSILGASSLANRNLPPGVTALGVPAKIVFQKPLPSTC